MCKTVWYRPFIILSLALLWSAPAFAQLLTSSGFKENFDSMGVDGQWPPDGWTHYTVSGGNGTWSAQTGIPANDLVTRSRNPSSGLTATNTPASNNNQGYNAAVPATPTDRALATSPTGVAGSLLELILTNNTGGPVTALTIEYDIRRFTVGAGGADELPGFWLFYSVDSGSSYTNVSALNPDITSVPNTVGVTHMKGTFTLSAPVANGDLIFLAWVDDNGVASSPDQIIGLDNVSISTPGAAPTPPSIGIRFFGSGGPPDSPAMDPSEVAGVVRQANWNQEHGAQNYNAPLNDANGVAVAGAILNYGCSNTWNTGIPDAPGDSRLMGAYLDSGSTDYTVVMIEGLSSLINGTYDVYLYANGNGHGGRHGFYSIVSGGFSVVTKECTDFRAFDPGVGYVEDIQDGNGGDYVHFTGIKGDTIFILVTAQNPSNPADNGFRAPLNGIQIVAN